MDYRKEPQALSFSSLGGDMNHKGCSTAAIVVCGLLAWDANTLPYADPILDAQWADLEPGVGPFTSRAFAFDVKADVATTVDTVGLVTQFAGTTQAAPTD
jgi:hypothetical protein